MVKFVFSPWKLRKKTFFAVILKIQWPDAHDTNLNPTRSCNPNADLMLMLTPKPNPLTYSLNLTLNLTTKVNP